MTAERVRQILLRTARRISNAVQTIIGQSVEELRISLQACLALEHCEILTNAELWDKPDSSLLNWQNFGRKSPARSPRSDD